MSGRGSLKHFLQSFVIKHLAQTIGLRHNRVPFQRRDAMWFKNLQIYQLAEDFTATAEDLHNAMQDKAFQPCQGLDTHRSGWTSVLGKHGDQLVHATDGCLMFCMRREERILPAAVVREAVDEKVDEIELQQSRQVGRKEKSEIKDEIIVDLLPRAFTRSQRSYGYIDPQHYWVILDCSTATRAEDMLTLMRETLGSFKVTPLAVNQSPTAIMTGWINEQAPADVLVMDECEMKEPVEKGGVIRMRGVDLGSAEVQQHLQSGRIISKLAIEWKQRLSCLLVDDLSVKRLKFLDIVLEQVDDSAADDAAMRFDADFALMSRELAHFIKALCGYYGGAHSAQ